MTRDGGVSGDWLVARDCGAFDAVPGTVPRTRRLARRMLREWRMESFTEGADVLVTELVTNAVVACREIKLREVIQLWLVPAAEEVLIVVWDASPQRPVRTDADDTAEGGRGLMLVAALSERWGWRPATGGGKFVWAVLGSKDPIGGKD